MYYPTRWDWATLAGSFGLFFALFYLFIRFLPDDFDGGGANAGAPDRRRENACVARAVRESMPQIFHRSANYLSRASIIGAVVLIGLLGFVLWEITMSPWYTDQIRDQAAAGAVQPPAPCRGAWNRLPLLPHVGGEIVVCGPSADADMHDVPLADLDQRRDARAGARELPHRRVAFLDSRERAARFRLFRSQHPRGEGDWMHYLSRAHRGDASDVPRRGRFICPGAWTAIGSRKNTCGRNRRCSILSMSRPPIRWNSGGSS